jgi:hypothetical protein
LAVILAAVQPSIDSAVAQTQPDRRHDTTIPARLEAVGDVAAPRQDHRAIRTCDDPDHPCYTAPQMHSYLVNRTHHFYHLAPAFRFPAAFIHLAQAAHASWCSHHPTQCKAQKAQWRADFNANPSDDCSPGSGWWCHERGLISCAGGGLVPYWSCDGAYHQDTALELDHKLTTTDKILIVGGDTMMCFLFPPGAPIVIGSGLVAMFNVWITNS